MHVLMLVVIGLVVLAAFYFGAGLFGRTGQNGAFVFIAVWLAASLVNGAVGVLHAGIPLMNEIGAFVLIFGIPAVIAWFIAHQIPE
jgi:hypothetical protein